MPHKAGYDTPLFLESVLQRSGVVSDAELADALERLLWIGDPDPKRDNAANLSYVTTILEEHNTLSTATQDLVHILVPSGLWRERDDLSQALLAALQAVWKAAPP